ncbi:DEAD/DEAH box helicase family protein [Halobacillus yeomjeoni]|uniref:DEAD/DEAH box helicase n=1 Tax=Halobacillus yeomjeoni TaxID=311194 RepID=A0A931HUB0_9BACI|nr:DEAD/DEAH box helicase family protein [Halobacillus yeomjeoni]MBH0229538.1 DEAD/DEAH box helicase [Halobacillus yeomjeoni]
MEDKQAIKPSVSDLITDLDIHSWHPNKIVTIKAGTGSGKSFFIKNKLHNIAKTKGKKILMLVNRKQPVYQFNYEIVKEGKTNITIQTYQKIEYEIRINKHFDFDIYDYIVCDEFHYFLQDDFNKWIDLSFDAIMSQTNKIRIFMSATGDSVTKYFKKLNHEIISYEMDLKYESIKNLYFFYKEDTIEDFIREAIYKKDKSIFFIESAEKAYELHKKFPKHTMFNCGKGSSKYYKHVDRQKVNNMLKREHFDELILITTTVMDTGVNIKDEDVRTIVVDVVNSGKIIQCIGRKRMLHDDDKVTVYIKARNKSSLNAYKRNVNKKIEKAEHLRKHGNTSYVNQYYRDYDRNDIVYIDTTNNGNLTHKVHELVLFKNRLDTIEYKEMEKKGYCKYIADLLDKPYIIVEGAIRKKNLSEYLESVVGGVMLSVTDRKELIEKINLRNGNNNRLVKNLNALNVYLESEGLDYKIKQFQTSRKIEGKKRNFKSAWKVRKIIDS